MVFTSLLANFAILASCAILALYVYVKYKFKYWERRNVPYKKPALLFGNFTKSLLMMETEAELCVVLYKEFQNQRFFGGFFSHVRALFICDPELIKAVLTKDFYHFYSRGFDIDPHKEPLDLNMFIVNGDLWRVLRQNLAPIFSSAKMKNMFKLMLESGKNFENYVIENIKVDQSTNVSQLTMKYSMDVIGSCAFGLQMKTVYDGDNQFSKMCRQIFKPTAYQYLKFLIRSFAKRLFYLFNIKMYNAVAEKFFIDLVKDIMKERETTPSTRQDFIDLVTDFKLKGSIKGNSINQLKNRNEQSQIELKIDDKLIAAQSFLFFAAGFDTSSMSISFTLYELALNPDVQNKLHDEIDSILQKYDNDLTYDSLNDFEYLEMVIHESWRKYPVAGTIERCCTSKYKIPESDVVIEEGVQIFIPVLAIHHDPKYYPDPYKFDPYRFTKQARSERHPYLYMPFGQGPRKCIGARFGKAQVMIGLISILRHYTVHPNQKTPNVMRFNPASFSSGPLEDICLDFRKR